MNAEEILIGLTVIFVNIVFFMAADDLTREKDEPKMKWRTYVNEDIIIPFTYILTTVTLILLNQK